MAEYKKLTKEDINFPKYCLFFIKNILEAIDFSTLSYVEFSEVHINTEYPYCSDAFDLIMKTFEKKGLDVKTPSFKMGLKDNKKYYDYKWKIRRGVNCDDLPF